jgi:hypothetical protein
MITSCRISMISNSRISMTSSSSSIVLLVVVGLV